MNENATLDDQSANKAEGFTQAGVLNRIIAKSVDLIVIIALYEIIPAIGYFAGVIYLLIADGLFDGRSLGKRLVGLKVVMPGDSEPALPCDFKYSTYRNIPFIIGYILFGILKVIPVIGWLISFVIILVIIIFELLVMIGNEKGMRLGDEIAGTLVIEERQGER